MYHSDDLEDIDDSDGKLSCDTYEELDPRASLARQNARYRAATSDRRGSPVTANPYAELARQRKATDLALALSGPSTSLPPAQRREALIVIADGIDKLTSAALDGVSDPVADRFFRQAEGEAGVNRSSPETWAEVAKVLRAIAAGCVNDPFERLS